MNFSEKKELIFRAYEKSRDIEIAFLKVGLSERDEKRILSDKVFNQRINISDAEYQEGLIDDLETLRSSALNDGIRFGAIKLLGEMNYSKRFKEKAITVNHNVPDTIILEGVEA